MELRRDDGLGDGVVEHEIDDPASGPRDDHLELRTPPRVQLADDLLQHRCLEPVVDPWAGSGEVPDAEIGTKGNANRDEYLEARVGQAGLDPPEVGGIDPDGPAQLGPGHVGIEPKAPDVLTRVGPDASRLPRGFAVDRGGREVHRAMKAPSACRAVTAGLTVGHWNLRG